GAARLRRDLPVQGRAAGDAKEALLRLGAGNLVAAHAAAPADHLLVGEIGRPAEGRTGAAPAVAAMADRIYQRRALDLDRAGAAAAARGHAAFAFSACATFEAGSRPSSTQIAR